LIDALPYAKATRVTLRERVTADIDQMRTSYAQLQHAAQQHSHAGQERIVGQGAFDPYADEDSSHDSLLSGGGGSGVGLQYQSSEYIGDLDGHLSMLESSARDRAEFMHQIESDVVQVAQLFSDVDYMVNAQQTMIDHIDANIEDTNENARSGMEQIEKAQQYQMAKRKKVCQEERGGGGRRRTGVIRESRCCILSRSFDAAFPLISCLLPLLLRTDVLPRRVGDILTMMPRTRALLPSLLYASSDTNLERRMYSAQSMQLYAHQLSKQCSILNTSRDCRRAARLRTRESGAA
jgi:hypothetical protein